MALETGNYISSLVKTNPVSSDNVSEGDDHLQLIKKILKQNFPVGTDSVGPDQAVQVLIAKSSAPTVDTSASGHAARAMGLLWLDTTNNLLKIRNQANDAWITLAVNPETSNSVDINAGTIDGTTIGASTASTGVFSSVNIAADGATVTGIKDEDDMASDSAVKLSTQQSIKAYVDSQVTAQDLDVISDSGTIDIDLDSESLTIAGGEGIDTSATSTTLTIAGEDASTSNKGVASFHSDNFSVSSGAVTIKDAGVANAELANMAANTVKVRDANSSGVPSDKAVGDGELLIGDGTGFTAAAPSSDISMTNAGVVTVTKIQGQTVSSTAPTNDQYMKYSTASNEWQMVSVVGDDKLTTKGDLLVYNTVDSETRLGVGTNNKVITANSSATNGLDWQYVAGDSMRMGSDAAGDTLYFNGTDYARLAKGSASQVLTMNSGATAPEWAAAGVADMEANTVKVRDANSTGAPSNKTVADTQILIGDGTGFTAAALSGDVTMANTGAVTIAANSVDGTMIALGSDAQGDVMYYNGTNYVRLAAGTDGHFLKTQGASANPVWAAASGGASDIDDLSDALVENNSIWLGNDPSSTTDTASNNVAVGLTALDAITTGDDNVAIGQGALSANTTGTRNTAVGWAAAPAVVSANDNTAMGWSALYATTGAENTAIGSYAMQSNTSGASNTALGDHALFANTTGGGNVAVGYQSLDANTIGSSNIAIGSSALGALTTAGSNVAVGNGAGAAVTTATSFTAIGASAGSSTTTGDRITAIGANALDANTTGASNVAVGDHALGANTTGGGNVAVGRNCLLTCTTGSDNVAMGAGALQVHTTGSYNCAFGGAALDANTTANNNVAVGYGALTSNTTGNDNVSIGYATGFGLTSGYNNTLLGRAAGYGVTTGYRNIGLGGDALRANSPAGNVTTGNDIACIGDDNLASLYCVQTSISSSDERDKTDIENFDYGLDFIKQMRPVSYRWDRRSWYTGPHPTRADKLNVVPDGTKKREKLYIGFLAQEVQEIEQSIGYSNNKDDELVVNTNEDDTALGIKYELIVPILVNAVKQLSEEVESLKAQLGS